MWVLISAINSFLIAFPALFSIVNPIGIALIYHQVTAGHTRAERAALAWRVAAYSLGVMVVSLLAGDVFRDTPIRRPLLIFRGLYHLHHWLIRWGWIPAVTR